LTRPWHFVFTALVEFEATGLAPNALEQEVAADITESQRKVCFPSLKHQMAVCKFNGCNVEKIQQLKFTYIHIQSCLWMGSKHTQTQHSNMQ
jgi:hypothetical protein